jgi:hypothetical protein
MRLFAVRVPLVLALSWAGTVPAQAQGFAFVPEQVSLSDTLGAEIVFNASCTNLTEIPLTLMFIRTMNALPEQWQSSMCLDVCYQSTQDTVITTPEYGSSPLQPGEVRPFSLHVYPAVSPGTGYIRILVLDRRNMSDSAAILFTATALPTGVEDRSELARAFHLEQNYPNPFNGGTEIRYRIKDIGYGEVVTLKVFDVLGREVAVLVDEPQPPGEHTMKFEAGELPSGVYLYRLGIGSQEVTKELVILR